MASLQDCATRNSSGSFLPGVLTLLSLEAYLPMVPLWSKDPVAWGPMPDSSGYPLPFIPLSNPFFSHLFKSLWSSGRCIKQKNVPHLSTAEVHWRLATCGQSRFTSESRLDSHTAVKSRVYCSDFPVYHLVPLGPQAQNGLVLNVIIN